MLMPIGWSTLLYGFRRTVDRVVQRSGRRLERDPHQGDAVGVDHRKEKTVQGLAELLAIVFMGPVALAAQKTGFMLFRFPAIPYRNNRQARGTAAVPVAASSTTPSP
jgi:hypothetical protein